MPNPYSCAHAHTHTCAEPSPEPSRALQSRPKSTAVGSGGEGGGDGGDDDRWVPIMFEPMPMPNRKRCWGRVASPIHATKGYDARTDEQTNRRTDLRTDTRTDKLLASLARLLASLVPLLAHSARFARTACSLRLHCLCSLRSHRALTTSGVAAPSERNAGFEARRAAHCFSAVQPIQRVSQLHSDESG